MKKLLFTLALSLAVVLPRASGVILYSQTWGTTNGFGGGNGTLPSVGWTGVAVSQTTGPFLGIYPATGANDPINGVALPQNSVYFTVLLPTQTNAGMFYTTDTAGSGPNGDTAFVAFNPALYTNLTFSIRVRDNGGNPSNYFAVQINGGQWYVSTNRLVPSATFAYPAFTYIAQLYTSNAAAWNLLTINATDVTIGATPGADLAGNITGVGIVQLPTTGGFDYNQLLIDQGEISPSPATITAEGISPQTVYVGGGASFVTAATGSGALIHRWQTNGVDLTEGGRYLGTTNNILTITNVNPDDALVGYTMTVSNLTGGDASASPRMLVVNPVPPEALYIETLPYVGPGGNLPLAGVGWEQAVSGTSRGIFQTGPGLGIFFDFSTPAATNAYFTTATNDTGLSGLPFVDIVPENHPAVTFQARFAPGNGAGTVAGNVRVYWMVRMDGDWYSSVSPIPTSLVQNQYDTNQLAFTRTGSNWNTLTIAGNVVTVGSPAGSDLTGNITGAGLLFIHAGDNASMNFQDFRITTEAVVVPPPLIGANYPIDRTVASGGGASFGVAASGQQPFTYGWQTNGVTVVNGGRVSGADGPVLTIRDLTIADDQLQIVAFVTNSVGFDRSDNFLAQPTVLTVFNVPPGTLIYSEDFPFVGPANGVYQISSAGWAEAVQNQPSTLFRRGTQGTTTQGDGAVFAFLDTAGTTVYYTSTALDTGSSGLPFPQISLSAYVDLAISVEIAPNSATASNVTAYLAVQLDGDAWYVAATALPVPNDVQSATFSTYTTPFNPAAAGWRHLTINAAAGVIGAPATSDLSGVVTGVGLVFVTVNNGGTFNFDNLTITGGGLGGIVAGPVSGGSFPLSWVGNPSVTLQSNTNLATGTWINVPNTFGLYSFPVSTDEPQKFYRLFNP